MIKQEKKQTIRETADLKNDIALVCRKLELKTGIEIGVRLGGNLKGLSSNPYFSKGKLIGMDCWQEVPGKPEVNDKSFTQDQLNAQYVGCVDRFKAQPWIEIVRDFSVEGASRFKDNYFDFIYLDAAHDYESVVDDLKAWWPKLKEGGIMSGHDYFPDHRVWRGKEVGVWRAVNEFAKNNNVEVCHMTTEADIEPGAGCPSFFIVK